MRIIINIKSVLIGTFYFFNYGLKHNRNGGEKMYRFVENNHNIARIKDLVDKNVKTFEFLTDQIFLEQKQGRMSHQMRIAPHEDILIKLENRYLYDLINDFINEEKWEQCFTIQDFRKVRRAFVERAIFFTIYLDAIQLKQLIHSLNEKEDTSDYYLIAPDEVYFATVTTLKETMESPTSFLYDSNHNNSDYLSFKLYDVMKNGAYISNIKKDLL